MDFLKGFFKFLSFLALIFIAYITYLGAEMGAYNQATCTVNKFNIPIEKVYPSYKHNPWYKLKIYLDEYTKEKQ